MSYGGAAEFWRRVNSGRVRLTGAEDTRLARMLAAGATFEEIAAAILNARRLRVDRFAPTPERKAEVLRGAWKAAAMKNARRWREQYRQEMRR